MVVWEVDELTQEVRYLARRVARWQRRRVGRARMPEDLWEAALDVVFEWGPFQAAQVLGLSHSTMKRRLEAREPGPEAEEATGPAFVEVLSPLMAGRGIPASWKSRLPAAPGFRWRSKTSPPGNCWPSFGVWRPEMLQIAPQMPALVAVKSIDGCVFVFRNRSGTAIKVLVYDGQGFWLAQKRLSQGKSRSWPTGTGASEPLEAHQVQVLLAAGDPSVAGAPVWRRVGLPAA